MLEARGIFPVLPRYTPQLFWPVEFFDVYTSAAARDIWVSHAELTEHDVAILAHDESVVAVGEHDAVAALAHDLTLVLAGIVGECVLAI